MKPTAIALTALACLLAPSLTAAEEPIDWEMVNRIRDEGFNRSQVMDTLEHLTDVIGPRLTGSPGARAANEWLPQLPVESRGGGLRARVG